MVQQQLMASQAEVMKSQARLNNVEADKKEGVDTELTKTEIGKMAAEIGNVQAQTDESSQTEKSDAENLQPQQDKLTPLSKPMGEGGEQGVSDVNEENTKVGDIVYHNGKAVKIVSCCTCGTCILLSFGDIYFLSSLIL